MLTVDIYGLKIRIGFIRNTDEEEVTSLLNLFLKDRLEKVDVDLKFKKKQRAQEIGGLIFPHLAKRNIWAVHSGGFHYQGGHLTVGPSNCGKSTLSFLAMQNGFSLLSDDVTLLRETDDRIEILPFYAAFFLYNKAIAPEPELFKPATLKYFLLPRSIKGRTFVKKVEKRSYLMRKLVPQFLWSYCKNEQTRQKNFLEKLCNLPAYKIYWGQELRDNNFFFKDLLNEIVSGKG